MKQSRSALVPWVDRLARAAAVAGADQVALLAADGGAPRVVAALGTLAPEDWPDRIGAGVVRRALKDGNPIAFHPGPDVVDENGTFASALLLPARAESGLLLVLFRRDRRFEPDETERYAALASLLADMQEELRARLRTANELERLEERLRAHEDLRAALATTRDTAALLDSATRAIAERFRAEAASVMLLDHAGELRVRAAVGLDPEVARTARRKVGEGIAGWVAQRGEGVILRGPVDERRFRGVDPEAGVAVSVPIRFRDDVVGVLNLKRPRAGASFDEEHLPELEAIAGELAAIVRHLDAGRGPPEAGAPAKQPEKRPEEQPQETAAPAPAAAAPRVAVFVVDDHPVLREGLRAVLERDGEFRVCGSASTLAEAIAGLRETKPDVVLCDIRLPDADNADAVRRISSSTGAVVVVFSVDTSSDTVAAALRAGARGYIPKRAAADEVRAAVRAAASGLLVLSPDLAPTLAPPAAGGAAAQPAPTIGREQMTPRELEYLRYLAEGYTNKEIAKAMVLAEDTVKKGIQALIAKLGAVDRTHAVVIALRADLID